MAETDNVDFVNDKKACRAEKYDMSLPGTKGTSWPWASLSRTVMRRGVAPDHMPRIAMLTVLASLDVNLGKEKNRKKVKTDCVAERSTCFFFNEMYNEMQKKNTIISTARL